MIPQTSEITSPSRSILHAVYSAREDWQFVAIYADQGITGTRTKKREDFFRLMREVKDWESLLYPDAIEPNLLMKDIKLS